MPLREPTWIDATPGKSHQLFVISNGRSFLLLNVHEFTFIALGDLLYVLISFHLSVTLHKMWSHKQMELEETCYNFPLYMRSLCYWGGTELQSCPRIKKPGLKKWILCWYICFFPHPPPPSTFHESKCYSVSKFQALICEICDGKFP